MLARILYVCVSVQSIANGLILFGMDAVWACMRVVCVRNSCRLRRLHSVTHTNARIRCSPNIGLVQKFPTLADLPIENRHRAHYSRQRVDGNNHMPIILFQVVCFKLLLLFYPNEERERVCSVCGIPYKLDDDVVEWEHTSYIDSDSNIER